MSSIFNSYFQGKSYLWGNSSSGAVWKSHCSDLPPLPHICSGNATQ